MIIVKELYALDPLSYVAPSPPPSSDAIQREERARECHGRYGMPS
jgi:hypothetical protein